jgi:hypothetical protein
MTRCHPNQSFGSSVTRALAPASLPQNQGVVVAAGQPLRIHHQARIDVIERLDDVALRQQSLRLLPE